MSPRRDKAADAAASAPIAPIGAIAVNVPGSTKTENINKPGTLTIRSHASLK